MKRFLTTFLVIAMPWAVQAECVGTNLIDALTPEQRAEFHSRIDAAPYPEGNLWQAVRDDTVLHVVGTMHLGDDRFQPLIDRLRPIVANADHVYLESSREDMSALQDKMTRDPSMLFVASGPTLIDRLDATDWDALSAKMEERGIPGFLAAKMQPWYAMMMLSVPACAIQSFSMDEGIDSQIMDIADASGVPTHSLEDPLDTLKLLAGDDPEQQIQTLRMTLSMTKDEDSSFTTMVDSYAAERHREIWEAGRFIAELEGKMTPEELDAQMAGMEQTLLINRNQAWIDKLRAELRPGNTIIAVGAAHLGGENGVLNLLAGEGYSLTRVE